jgi:voltage-gated potassium channel
MRRKWKDHVILCGFGRYGKALAQELEKQGIDYVVVEKERKEAPAKLIEGDARREEVLREAGIEDAKAMVVVVENDADAAFITLTARGLNPDFTIVVNARKLESIRKIYQAGATKVVSTSVIGGRTIAKMAVRPLVAEFIDRITFMKDVDLAQLPITKDSPLHHQRLVDLHFSERGISLLALYRGDKLISAPPQDTVLEEGDVLVILGSSRNLIEAGEG